MKISLSIAAALLLAITPAFSELSEKEMVDLTGGRLTAWSAFVESYF
jgi:hypothetical protein